MKNIHSRLSKFFVESRKKAAKGEAKIDWATAEAVAFGSLLLDNFDVRISGQDAARGTFSHRHGILVDTKTEEKFVPLNELASEQGRIEVKRTKQVRERQFE